MRKALQELRYKCGRHNTDSAIPDNGVRLSKRWPHFRLIDNPAFQCQYRIRGLEHEDEVRALSREIKNKQAQFEKSTVGFRFSVRFLICKEF